MKTDRMILLGSLAVVAAVFIAACDDVVAPSPGEEQPAPERPESRVAPESSPPEVVDPPVAASIPGRLTVASSRILSSYNIEVVAGDRQVTILWNGSAESSTIDGYWLGYWDVLTRTWKWYDSNNNTYKCARSAGCSDSYTITGLVNGRSYWFVIYAYRGQPGSYSFPSRSALSAKVLPRNAQFSYYACQQFGDSMPASGVFVDSRRSNHKTIAYNACLESKASSGTSAGRASVITSSPKLLTDCDASRESVTNMVYMAVINLATDVLRATVKNEEKLEKFLSDMWQTIAQQCAARPPSPVTVVGRAIFVPPISNYRVQYLSAMPGSTDPNEVYCPIVRKWLETCPQCTNTRVQHCTPASCQDVEICTNTRVEHCTPPSCEDVKICTNTRICDENGCRWDRVCGTERRCTPETCEFRWDRVCNTERQCTPERCEWRWDTVCSDT